MTFHYCDSFYNQYRSLGYVVFRDVIPHSLLQEMRVQADKARDLAHTKNGAQAQRIQPLDRYADEIDVKPFQAYGELDHLRDAVEKVLGGPTTYCHTHIMGFLTEPTEHPWTIGWHRDGVVEVPQAAYDDSVHAYLGKMWDDWQVWNQINCALYRDSCTWYVPGSHLRQKDLPGEFQHTSNAEVMDKAKGMSDAEAERYFLQLCLDFPGAMQVHLEPGDFMLYRNLGWHNGNYTPYARRATMHDAAIFKNATSDYSEWGKVKAAAVERMKEKQAATVGA